MGQANRCHGKGAHPMLEKMAFSLERYFEEIYGYLDWFSYQEYRYARFSSNMKARLLFPQGTVGQGGFRTTGSSLSRFPCCSAPFIPSTPH
jgi:hypothetical protein